MRHHRSLGNLPFESQRHWPSVAARLINRLDQRDDSQPILTGDLRRAIFEDRPKKVLDLEGVVIGNWVNRDEPGAVFGLEPLEQVLLAGDGPEVVERRLGDARVMPAMKVAPAVGLDADRGPACDPWMCTLV